MLKQQFPDTPILALTATATQAVRLAAAAAASRRWLPAPAAAQSALRLHSPAIARSYVLLAPPLCSCCCSLMTSAAPWDLTSPPPAPQVCDDLRSILRIEGCEFFRSSINRPNLYYEARPAAPRCARCAVLRHALLHSPYACRPRPALSLCTPPPCFPLLSLMGLLLLKQVVQKPAAPADLAADIARWVRCHYPGGESGKGPG